MTVIPLGRPLLGASSDLPESRRGSNQSATARGRDALCLTLLQVGFTEPIESPRLLVRSYRTVSPLPRSSSLTGAQLDRGGLLSVALSLVSRPVDVIDHLVLRSPDFPPVRWKDLRLSNEPATIPLAPRPISSGYATSSLAARLANGRPVTSTERSPPRSCDRAADLATRYRPRPLAATSRRPPD